jgi:hypothetical protein
MEREWDYLLHLIRCAIHDIPPEEVPEGVDLQQVYECGVYHHVANLAFYSVERLKTPPSGELYDIWKVCRDKALVLDLNQCFAAEEIRDAFSSANIRWLEMQGTRIKPFYTQSDWRTMSDIDFIVDSANLKRAGDILRGLGYVCKNVRDKEIVGFRMPNIHVELHVGFFPDNTIYSSVLGDTFSAERPIDTFYLYNILHIVKHYLYGGCGIRRVLDLYLLNQAYGECVDRDYVQAVLKRVDAAELVSELMVLANDWFGTGISVKNKMTQYIFYSGLHGNRLNELENRLKHSDTHGIKYLFERFRGNEQAMYIRYPILEKYKILYPFCWLHRGVLALKPGKRKRLKREIKAVRNKI